MKIIRKVCIGLILLFCFSVKSFSADDIAVSIQIRIQKFQSRYGIPIVFNDIPFLGSNIVFKSASPQEMRELDQYLILFDEEIGKYPPEFFKEREVRAIGMVTHLFFRKKIAQGVYSPQGRFMLFDFTRFSDNKALQRHSIHHEIYHMMALQTPSYKMEDEYWAKLNQEGFIYGDKKNLFKKMNPYNPQAPAVLGFVTDYAMTSVEEDKAEVFACLMQANHRRLITEWAKKDQILQKKINLIKAFVALFCPQMSEE